MYGCSANQPRSLVWYTSNAKLNALLLSDSPNALWFVSQKLTDCVDTQHFTPRTWMDLRTLNRLCVCSAYCPSCPSFASDESWFFLDVLTNNNLVRGFQIKHIWKICETIIKSTNNFYYFILHPKFTKITTRSAVSVSESAEAPGYEKMC